MVIDEKKYLAWKENVFDRGDGPENKAPGFELKMQMKDEIEKALD